MLALKGLEVSGRGDVKAKGSSAKVTRSLTSEDVYSVQEGAAATGGSLYVPAAMKPMLQARLGRRLVRARRDVCAGVLEGWKGSRAKGASAARY